MNASARAQSPEPPAPDAELVRSARAGQAQAFADLVERHQSLARAVAFSACDEFASSEDIAQEALVTAWLRLGDLDDPEKFRFWLATIVRNTARYFRRHQKRHAPPASVGVDALTIHAAEQPTPLQCVEAREDLDHASRALGSLPLRLREPLVLYYVLGESYPAVAATLEISEAAVRQRICRARKRLREETGTVQRGARALARRGGMAAAVLVALRGRFAWSASAASGAMSWATPKLLLWTLVGLCSGALAVCIVALVALLGQGDVVNPRSGMRAGPELPSASPGAESSQSPAVERTTTDVPTPGAFVRLGAGRVESADADTGADAAKDVSERDARARTARRAAGRSGGAGHGSIRKHGPAVLVPSVNKPFLRPALDLRDLSRDSWLE